MRRIPMPTGLLLAATALVMLTACGKSEDPTQADRTPSVPSTSTDSTADASPSPDPSSSPTDPQDLEPRLVAQGLEVPWGIAFLPNGAALIAQRNEASIVRLDPDGTITDLGTLADVVPTSEGGLLGLAVSPTYARDQTIYAYVTTAEDNRVLSLTYDGGASLGTGTPILTGIPAGEIHDGGRMAFGPDGKLYITTGETGDGPLAQDLDSLGGKILRVEADGSIPRDNPDPDSPVWTFGHRNVQGIAFDDEDRLWATEFGSTVWDELNLIEPGNNYGWPVVEGRSDEGNFTEPLIQWTTGEASPSGIAYLDHNLYVAALGGHRLFQIPLSSDGTPGEPKILYDDEYGRLRTVVATPDDTLWFTTSNLDGRGQPVPTDDRIFEISP